MSENRPIGQLAYFSLVITACTLWGSAFAGAKIGFEYCGPVLLSGIRFSLAGLLLVPLLLSGKSSFLSHFKEWRFMLLFGFIQTFLQYGLFFMGLNEVKGAVAAIIVGGGPLFVTVLAHLTIHDDRFTRRKVVAILLGFSGILFIALSKGEVAVGGDQRFYYGVGLLLLSNIIGSSTNIIVFKNKHRNISSVALTAFANFTGGIMLLVVALLFEPIRLDHPPLVFYGAVLWLAMIPAAAFSIWYYLLSLPGVKVSELNIWKFIIPVVGAVLSWLFVAGESPTWQEIVGIVVISTSIIVLQWQPRKRVK